MLGGRWPRESGEALPPAPLTVGSQQIGLCSIQGVPNVQLARFGGMCEKASVAAATMRSSRCDGAPFCAV